MCVSHFFSVSSPASHFFSVSSPAYGCHSSADSGPIDCLYKTFKTEGVRGLYKGSFAHLLRFVVPLPFSFRSHIDCPSLLSIAPHTVRISTIPSGSACSPSFHCYRSLPSSQTSLSAGNGPLGRRARRVSPGTERRAYNGIDQGLYTILAATRRVCASTFPSPFSLSFPPSPPSDGRLHAHLQGAARDSTRRTFELRETGERRKPEEKKTSAQALFGSRVRHLPALAGGSKRYVCGTSDAERTLGPPGGRRREVEFSRLAPLDLTTQLLPRPLNSRPVTMSSLFDQVCPLLPFQRP